MRQVKRDEFGAVPADLRDRTCLIGRRIHTEYRGGDGRVHCIGRIVEVVGRAFGVTFDDYAAYGRPIVVDLQRGEFILPRAV